MFFGLFLDLSSVVLLLIATEAVTVLKVTLVATLLYVVLYFVINTVHISLYSTCFLICWQLPQFRGDLRLAVSLLMVSLFSTLLHAVFVVFITHTVHNI